MERFNIWVSWLKVVGFCLIAFGLVMALFNSTGVFRMFNQGIDPDFWPEGISESGTLAFRTWVYGAWGATIAGWGVSLLLLVHNAFAARERWAWFAITAGLSLWYIFDTGVSAYFGVGFNVAFNSLILLMVGIPLVASYKEFNS